MTDEKVINQVFGNEWQNLSIEQKTTVEKMLEYMGKNFGITPSLATKDRQIIAAMQLACLEVFGETYDTIMSKNRKRYFVEKRMMMYKIARELSKSSDSKLSMLFPLNRSTCFYYGIKTANDLIDSDKDFRDDFQKLRTSTIEHLKEIENESLHRN